MGKVKNPCSHPVFTEIGKQKLLNNEIQFNQRSLKKAEVEVSECEAMVRVPIVGH